MRKFTWCQDIDGNSQSYKFNVLESSFGDGYKQSASIGINNKRGEYQYTRTAESAIIDEIRLFLDEHKRTKAFLWDSPKDGEITVKSGDYTMQFLGGDAWRISTVFEQSFQV